ncbi:MAG TPA: GTPase ObgE [Candidatus Hydrogenedentes bacterium]|nr:GTPase ObgE [Candidatus Hydrogenedentota bacterium]HPG65799.1 GTPase ObgE [Candidatus Hydrogenedentota bacterium]
MFTDRVRVHVVAGAGGNGCCSFRREKYVPRGGPNGGDGGNGGDVVFVAASRLASLEPLRYRPHIRAERGEHGRGSDCHGRTGAEERVNVPCGTLVRDLESGAILSDLSDDGSRFLAARGGRGGKGNARFASSTHRAPHFAELGEPGAEADYVLELKLIAEVGLVGLPNAGKSTLLSRISGARPKIDSYPFTTLSPNLGVVVLDVDRTITVADIPGIIEGAADGKGLGHDFLRHIERTKVLVFLIDLGDEDPVATRDTLEHELFRHSEVFRKRPSVVVLNKVDVTENRRRFDEVASRLGGDPFLISAVTGEGVPPLLDHLWRLLETARATSPEAERVDTEAEREYTFEAPYTITRGGGGFLVEGQAVVRAIRMTDFENDEAIRHLHDTLRRMGLFKALKRMGAQAGDTITIGSMDLEYSPDD